MTEKETLRRIIDGYEKLYGRNKHTESFGLFADACENLTARTTLAGHVTGSAVVLDRKTNTALRVFNPKLNLWVFSAGGHIDPGERPWEGATRELAEEVGIHAEMIRVGPDDALIPFFFEVQPIGASLTKKEPAHYHYDMVYLFEVDGQPELTVDPREVAQYTWVPVSDIAPPAAPLVFAEALERTTQASRKGHN